MTCKLTGALKSELESQALMFDYIRLNVTDFRGKFRGNVLPKEAVARCIDNGIGIYPGSVGGMGIRHNAYKCEPFLSYLGGNVQLLPSHPKVIPTPWTGSGKYPYGMVHCHTMWKDNRPQEFCPRHMTIKQLQKLKDLGYEILSSFEHEFQILDAKEEPVFKSTPMKCDEFYSLQEDLLTDIHHDLKSAGMEVEAMAVEAGPGEYEINLRPRYGIATCDDAVILRDCVRARAMKRGLLATFMSQVVPEVSNGLHLNMSLWDDSGGNVFSDPQAEDGLSETCRHWLAGLIKHAPALSAICSPTVNCYRRRFGLGIPKVSDWGFDSRLAAYRLNGAETNQSGASLATFIESRLPGGSSNPYLVFTATVAAGIDGLVSILACPEPMASDAEKLPEDLETALLALEKDAVIVNALGSEFMSLFTLAKRTDELVILENSNVAVMDPAMCALERELYI